MAGQALREAEVLIKYIVDDSDLQKLKNLANTVLGGIGEQAENGENSIKQLTNAVGEMVKELKAMTSNLEAGFNSLTRPAENLDNTLEAIEDTARDLGDSADNGLRDLGDSATNAVRDIDRLENGIDDISGDLRQLDSAANAAGNETEQAGEQAQEAADDYNALEEALGGVKTAFLGMAGAFGASAIFDAADDITKAMNQYQAATGAAGAELEQFAESSKRIYTSGTGESLEDVARSMALIKQVTGESTLEVEGMTNSALALRDTFEMEVNESIRSVDMIMTQFGVDSNTAFGMLAQGAQMGLDQNQNLLDSFNEYSVHFKKMGFSAEGMMNLFSKVADTGVYDVDKIGDAVKEFSIRAIDGSKLTMEAFGTIGLNAEEVATAFTKGGDEANAAFIKVVEGLKAMEDPIAQDAAGVALFGTMWEDMGKTAVLAMADTTNTLGSAGEAMDKLNEVKYDDATTALSALGRTVNMELGEVATEAVKELQSTFIELKESGAIETIFDGLSSTVSVLVGTFREVKTAATEIYTFMSENWGTIGPLIKGITIALIALKTVQLAYNAGLKLQAAIEAIRSGAVLASTAAIWANNIAMLASPWTWVVLAIVAVIAIIVLCIVYWDEISAAIVSWSGVVMEYLGIAWEFIVWCFEGIWNVVKSAMTSVWTFIVSVWTAVWEFIGPVLTAIWNLYVATWTAIFNIISAVLQGIFAVIVRVWQAIFAFLSPIITAIWSYISEKWNAISNAVSVAMGLIRTAVVGIWNAIKAAVLPILEEIWDKVTEAFNAGLEFLKGLATDFLNAGRDLIQGLINGMVEKLGALTEVVNQIGEKVVEGTKAFFKIKSPSRIMREIGVNVVKGQEVGMLAEMPALSSVADNVATAGMPMQYTPENTMGIARNSVSSTNNLAPVFNLTINGSENPRDLERKVRQWILSSMNDTFASLSRSNPRLREV